MVKLLISQWLERCTDKEVRKVINIKNIVGQRTALSYLIEAGEAELAAILIYKGARLVLRWQTWPAEEREKKYILNYLNAQGCLMGAKLAPELYALITTPLFLPTPSTPDKDRPVSDDEQTRSEKKQIFLERALGVYHEQFHPSLHKENPEQLAARIYYFFARIHLIIWKKYEDTQWGKLELANRDERDGKMTAQDRESFNLEWEIMQEALNDFVLKVSGYHSLFSALKLKIALKPEFSAEYEKELDLFPQKEKDSTIEVLNTLDQSGQSMQRKELNPVLSELKFHLANNDNYSSLTVGKKRKEESINKPVYRLLSSPDAVSRGRRNINKLFSAIKHWYWRALNVPSRYPSTLFGGGFSSFAITSSSIGQISSLVFFLASGMSISQRLLYDGAFALFILLVVKFSNNEMSRLQSDSLELRNILSDDHYNEYVDLIQKISALKSELNSTCADKNNPYFVSLIREMDGVINSVHEQKTLQERQQQLRNFIINTQASLLEYINANNIGLECNFKKGAQSEQAAGVFASPRL